MEEYKAFRRNLKRKQRFKFAVFQIADQFFGRKKIFKNRTKFYKELFETLPKHGEGKIMSIERRVDLSLEEFKNHYVKKGIPVVLEGAAKDWDCVKNWSLDYFNELHGNDEIVLFDFDIKDKYEMITLSDVIKNIKSGGKKYYRFYPLLARHPEHINDFDYKWLKERSNSLLNLEAFQIFMGGKNTKTHLHNANPPNIFVQAYGEKHWFLYSHYYSPIIDPSPTENMYREAPNKRGNTPFDPFIPDFDSPYELFKYIDGYSAHLKPGDVLWNPPFYWHAVNNTTDSIGVGYRWIQPMYSFKISPLFMFLDFCSFKPPIWKTWSYFKKDINQLNIDEMKKLNEAKRKMQEQKNK
ncbi:MAG: cupin-like domain-containing protein [Burkholderiales bacterium]|nr:cupin-like domain-containing protein [Bacteroidia bacterium]